MCKICGCDSDKATAVNLQTGTAHVFERDASLGEGHGHSQWHEHEHIHADGTRHRHSHPPDEALRHAHEHKPAAGALHAHAAGAVVSLEQRVLAKNDALAQRNRAWLAGHGVTALNLMSAPGAGKTTLLERSIRDLKGQLALFVIEGDQATSNDGERIRAAGAPAVQVNTGTGCHLDADMIAHGLAQLSPGAGSVAVIENVGNLVCPALFDLGEDARVVVFSVTEGDDKPAKYPHMFRTADVVLLNKTDLLPHVDFDIDQAERQLRHLNPRVEVMRISARSGAGLDRWYAWLRGKAAARALAPPARGAIA